MDFSTSIITWYEKGHRELPWRNTRDPYKIWLSEIILQQTRVDQGMEYYHRFLDAFPRVEDLATADEAVVLKLWQGLGYYSRARNLRTTAQIITDKYKGQFPESYTELLDLKGVGPYTAAAIASFAFKIPMAVVDGNVYRVLSRYFGLDDAIDSTTGKKRFQELAQELISQDHPDSYNQAIMELGATVCKPKSPSCDSCPVAMDCVARREGLIHDLPRKEKKTKIKALHLHYLILQYEDELLIRHRTQKGFWHKLWDFTCVETENEINQSEVEKEFSSMLSLHDPNMPAIQHMGTLQHILSHRKLKVHFFGLQSEERINPPANHHWIKKEDYKQYALPRVVDKFWEELAKDNGQTQLFPLGISKDL